MAPSPRPTPDDEPDSGADETATAGPDDRADDDLTLAERILKAKAGRADFQAGPGDRLRRAVHITDPATGRVATFLPGEEVPGWARELIRNPAAWATKQQAARAQFDVARSTMAEVEAAVDEGLISLDEAAAAEQLREGGPRTTLLRRLNQRRAANG